MKWTLLTTFAYTRLKAYRTVVDGVAVLHLKHEHRISHMHPWKHVSDDYTIEEAKSGFKCQSEAEVPAMVAQFIAVRKN